jgi:hypothetical protein
MDGLVSKASDDLAVAPSSPDFRNIGLQHNARLRRPLGGTLSFADRRLEPARSFRLNRTTYFSTATSFRYAPSVAPIYDQSESPIPILSNWLERAARRQLARDRDLRLPDARELR